MDGGEGSALVRVRARSGKARHTTRDDQNCANSCLAEPVRHNAARQQHLERAEVLVAQPVCGESDVGTNRPGRERQGSASKRAASGCHTRRPAVTRAPHRTWCLQQDEEQKKGRAESDWSSVLERARRQPATRRARRTHGGCRAASRCGPRNRRRGSQAAWAPCAASCKRPGPLGRRLRRRPMPLKLGRGPAEDAGYPHSTTSSPRPTHRHTGTIINKGRPPGEAVHRGVVAKAGKEADTPRSIAHRMHAAQKARHIPRRAVREEVHCA